MIWAKSELERREVTVLEYNQEHGRNSRSNMMPRYLYRTYELRPDGDSSRTCDCGAPRTSRRRSSRDRSRPAMHQDWGEIRHADADINEPVMSGALPTPGGRTDSERNRNAENQHRERNTSTNMNERNFERAGRDRRGSEPADDSDRGRRASPARGATKTARPLKGILKKPRGDDHQQVRRRVSFSSDENTGRDNARQSGKHADRNGLTAPGRPGTEGSRRPHRPENQARDEYESERESDEARDRTDPDAGEVEGKNDIDAEAGQQYSDSPRQAWSGWGDCVSPHASTSKHPKRGLDVGRTQHDLLHNHQTWCRGRCTDVQQFVRKLGACGRCARSMTEPIHPSARCALMPICRTWIHCCSKAMARDLIFGPGGPSSSEKALRIGFADAYVCELRGYVGIEAYLAFLRHKVQETMLFDWLLEPNFKMVLDHTARVGELIPDNLGTMECDRLEYLGYVVREAKRTGELWASIVAWFARYDERVNQESIGRLVDEWILGQTSKCHRRPRHRSH